MKKVFFVLTAILSCYLAHSQTQTPWEKYQRDRIALANKGINLKPNASDYNQRGSAKSQLGDYRGATADFSIALKFELDEDFRKWIDILFYNRAQCLVALEDYRGAIADCNSSLEFLGYLDKKFEFLRAGRIGHNYSLRGYCKLYLKDYRGAIVDYTSAIEVLSKDAISYYNRGMAKTFLGQKDSACLDFSKAGELGSKDAYEKIAAYCN
jgi:tetratricopeptide (TPR) repeat protein